MNTYIGTKIVKAEPMSRLQYNEYRGWALPADENGDDEGYLVEYLDGGKANMPDRKGYVSWSPKEVFENAYRDSANGLTFGEAIIAMKQGARVARAGWNGKGMWLELIGFTGECHDVYPILPWIGMKTADNKFVPWLASQTDMLAEDWRIVE